MTFLNNLSVCISILCIQVGETGVCSSRTKQANKANEDFMQDLFHFQS